MTTAAEESVLPHEKTRAKPAALPVRVFDALPRLVEAVRWGNQKAFDEIVGKMIEAVAEARPPLAESLRRIGSNTLVPMRGEHQGARFAQMERPVRKLADVILPGALVRDVEMFLDEHSKRDALAAFALVPRHRILLHGPPGNGKTLLAEALSAALDVPLLRVRYGMIVDSHLGETNKNLQHLLDYASTGPCVLFFDEFDSVATKRGLQSDVGELRRVTNWLLMHLERLNPKVTLVAATNTLDQLDEAIVRRFDTKWSLPAPTLEIRRRCAALALSPEVTFGLDLLPVAERIAAMDLPNLNAVVGLCERVRRDYALSGGVNVEAILTGGLSHS